ncbi:MAG TPA: LysM peptidoglycan-binding domain-containing protein, partial [Opitutaceae bacterium]
ANAERTSLSEKLSAAEAKANSASSQSSEVETLRAQLASAQQELAAAKAAAAQPAPTPAPTAPTEDVAALHKQLDETQGKLEAALRTYQLQQEEQERLQKALANIDAERASLADRLQTANTQASQATAQASVNQDATAQLAATREQLRQVQNEAARLATENSQLRIRAALPPAQNQNAGVYAFGSAPTRPSGPNPAGSLNAFGSANGAASAPASTPLRPGSVAATAASAPAPTPTPAVRTYTIVDGDTLTRISRKMYGSSERWPQILEANHDVIKDPKNLTVGVKLKIP